MKKKLLAALLASALAAGLLPTSACAASDYTTANATLVTLTDSSATAKGKYTGYEIDGTDVSITAAGTYVFSGDCDNGSITVKKGVTGVTIVLNSLTLTNDDSAAITLNKTAEASLIAAAGTTNTVADTAGSNDENAAVKVKSGAALAIGGTGTLTVDGNAKNGIKGAADAVITVAEVKLNINAADDGLSCDDELNITGGTLSITAGGDAEYLAAVRGLYGKGKHAGTLEFKNHFYLERGPYEIVAVVDENADTEPFVLEGKFIDLFDPALPVLTRRAVLPGTQALLYNLDTVADPGRPQVLACAACVETERVGRNRYSFMVKGPAQTTNVMRVLLPRKPVATDVTRSDGTPVADPGFEWDEESRTCLLRFENAPEGVNVALGF